MSQFFTHWFARDKQPSSQALNVVQLYRQSLEEDEHVQGQVVTEDLLTWAQSFCNIDSNNNQMIEPQEFKAYVQQNYRSAIRQKKDEKVVVDVAMKYFKAALKESENDSEDIGALDFKHFVNMMQDLRRVARHSSEADFKFYDFLRKTNAKKEIAEDSSVRNAKLIEKAAEWRNDIAKYFNPDYLKLYDAAESDGIWVFFDNNPCVFFIVIRAQLNPLIKFKSSSADKHFQVATAILTRPEVLQHINKRGKPHKETCLNHAYLVEQVNLARLIVKLDRRLHDSSYRGSVFFGENSLHIMIAKNDSKNNKMLDEARWLLGMKSEDEYCFQGSDGKDLKKYLFDNRRNLLHQPAVGSFFDKDDKQMKAYFGEFPLSFAVSRNSYEFVKFLVVDCNCWMDKQDKHGNTAAHLAVYHDNFDMFLFLWKLWDLGMKSGNGRSQNHRNTRFLELESTRNGDESEFGMTPLVYAAQLGKVDFFTKLWDYMGRNNVLDDQIDTSANQLVPIQWKWGSIRQFLYPLEQIDPIGQTCVFESDIDISQDLSAEAKKLELSSAKAKKLALKSVPIFEKASDSVVDMICSNMELKDYSCGSSVVVKGKLSNGKMYIIQSGSCEIFKGSQRLPLRVRYFGELGAFGHQHDEKYKYRAATVTTMIDSHIWELNIPDPLPNLHTDHLDFLMNLSKKYESAKRPRCVLNEALSEVTSNIMRKAHDDENNHLQLLNSGFLKVLIDTKWQRFGEEKFKAILRWSIFLYVITLLAIIMRYPGKHSSSSFLVEQMYTYMATSQFSTAEEIGLYSEYPSFQLFLCFLPDLVVIASSIRELCRCLRYQNATFGMKWKPDLLQKLSLYLSILTLLAYVFEMLMLFGVTNFLWVPVILVISCSVIRSVQIIVFLLASATQGEFVLMIMTIMFQDMPQFMMIVIVLTFAFSQIFLLLHTLVDSKSQANSVIGSLEEFWRMLYRNFKHVFGEGFEDKDKGENIVLEFCSLIAALAITIVLVNMLIASMSETFDRVRKSKASEMMYQKAKMIAMIELEMPLKERIEKKFWVEVKPVGCKEKKPFMVIHDDGVSATANPESATFPDSCQVTLNLPHAKLLHEKQGMIVGVRDPISNRYDVQLQHEADIKAWGNTIFKAAHGEIKWRESVKAQSDDLSHLTEKEKNFLKGSNKKSLPARPFFKQSEETNSCQLLSKTLPFTSPNTSATEGSCLRDTPVLVSPPKQRNVLASPSSRSSGQTRRGASSLEHTGFRESSPPSLAINFDSSSCTIISQHPAVTHSDGQADSSPEAVASLLPSSTKRLKRKLSIAEQREFARARVTPAAASKTTVSKRLRDADTPTMSLRSQRILRSKN